MTTSTRPALDGPTAVPATVLLFGYNGLVIGTWAYAGMGWLNEGDRALATGAADAARQWREDRARDRRTQPTERSKS